jgi:hypothetical protein
MLFTAISVVKFTSGSGSGWMWLFFGSVALVVLSFWRVHQTRIAVERRFEAIRFALICEDVFVQDRASPPSVRLGIRFMNVGNQALRYAVESMTVVIDGHTLTNPQFSTDGAVLAAEQQYFYWFPWLPNLRLAHGTKGEVAYIVHYGHPTDRFRFRMTHKQEFECLVGRGSNAFSAHLLDIEPPTVVDLLEDQRNGR